MAISIQLKIVYRMVTEVSPTVHCTMWLSPRLKVVSIKRAFIFLPSPQTIASSRFFQCIKKTTYHVCKQRWSSTTNAIKILPRLIFFLEYTIILSDFAWQGGGYTFWKRFIHHHQNPLTHSCDFFFKQTFSWDEKLLLNLMCLLIFVFKRLSHS